MNPVETYLTELRTIRSTGAAVPETSYYAPLASLFNEIGKALKPKVRCVMTLKNQGAGLPDGGLFTSGQFQRASDPDPLPGQMPERGVIEVKSAADDAWLTAEGEQVTRYWGRYRQVLVTNYRDFVLVGKDREGRPAKLETFRLADSEAAFWSAAAHPRTLAETLGERLTEYVKRVMLYPAPLAEPEDAAWFLASYARDAKARIEGVDLPALSGIRAALEEALGIRFESEKGDHFFRSTLVQTLFYGVFSAWVLWSKHLPELGPKPPFDWRVSAHLLRVPILRKLFHEVSEPGQLEALKLSEVLDWSAAALNRVDRAAFFARFEEKEGHAVQYFYEPFLQAFDPELRKELGVWYTPPEIVQYMVARVDTVLREELDLPDGLADPNVYVLDPCCGTATYLLEVLRRIAATLKEKGGDALVAQDLKEAAMRRVFGFEILPAPFVVSHLQLGLLLESLGAPLSEKGNERVGVYLTNALTGWEPPKGPKQRLMFAELEEEREAAERVKRDTPILVILGNPPYNAFAGVSPVEEHGLVEPYKQGLISEWGIKKFNLDDLYVRFFRLAERRIAEMTRKGVVCFISNFSYLEDPSFVVMRRRFLAEFDGLWFDCLNGDSRETGKLTPEGKPDPSVFSTEYNREGIRVGTAIGLMVRKAEHGVKPVVRFRQFWGVTKREDLLKSLSHKDLNADFERVKPDRNCRFSFRPSRVSSRYLAWPRLVELCGTPPGNGLLEKRGGALIDVDRSALEKRMRMYYDPEVDWETLEALATGLTVDAAGFDAEGVRPKVQAAETYAPSRLVRYALRPFDVRWCYYSDVSPLWNRARPTLWAQCREGNRFLMCRPAAAASPEGVPFFFTRLLGDNDFLRGHAYYFPFGLRAAPVKSPNAHPGQNHCFTGMDAADAAPTANLSPAARAYLAALRIPNPDVDPDTAGLVWMHALAIGYSPAYLSENADGIRQDWPRIPLPNSRKALLASAALGRKVAALLDTESLVQGVTTGAIRPELRAIGVISRVGGGSLNPDAGDLNVEVGWGHAGKDGVTMPGKGKLIERDVTAEELDALAKGAKALGQTAGDAVTLLGKRTYDVFLNDVAYWKNVPARVWDYTIGGYQVIKKWLSYREADLLGRSLTPEEAREVMNTARRIAAILLLEPALDANYLSAKSSTYSWPKDE